jgi:type II secretory pathway component PulF
MAFSNPFRPKIRFEQLSRFADSMATCLSSGLSPEKALRLSGAMVESASFQRMIADAARACDQGLTVSEALRAGGRFFPHFFLPLIAAGELSGRQVEAFALVHEHCQRLKPTLAVVRKTWLYPLVCTLFGWTVRTGLFLGFGRYDAAWYFVADTFLNGLVIVSAGWFLLQIRPVREAVDRALLHLPLVREVEIRLSMALFFATFRLLYSTGGLGVTAIFDHALGTVRNSAVRRDLLRSRMILENNGGFDDAFLEPMLLEPGVKGILATSAVAGQLDAGLDKVVTIATDQLELALNVFNQFFLRLLTLTVGMSIAETLWICLNDPRGH